MNHQAIPHNGSLGSRWRGIAHDPAAEGEDAGIAFGGFGFGDVAELDVDLGEARPGEEVVRFQIRGHEGGSEGGLEVAVARGGWKTKGESFCALLEYFLNSTTAISTAGRALCGYPNPRVPCFPQCFRHCR